MASSEFEDELQQECLRAAQEIESPDYQWLRPFPKIEWIVFFVMTAVFLVLMYVGIAL